MRGRRLDDDEEHVVLMTGFFVILSVFTIQFIYHRYEKHPDFAKFATYFPQASCNIVWGIIFGGILAAGHEVDETFSFSPEFFFDYLLPPIIFAAGFLLRKDIFFHNFASIIVLAFAGTFIAALFTGCVIWMGGEYWNAGYNWKFMDAMVFGSLISAIDPVATIALLEKICVDQQLYLLIFGEAVLNDAVAVVFFKVFSKIADGSKSASEGMAEAVGLIILSAICSTLIGIIFALCLAYIHKNLELCKHPEVEIGLFIVGAMIPYYVAEALDFSGIMAALFAGVFADHYIYYHLSTASRITVSNLLHTVAQSFESFVFVYLGMALFAEKSDDYNVEIIFITLFCCLVGRGISVLFLCWLLNFGRKNKISMKYQITMWFAGLRGPVAFALSLMAPNETEVMVCATLIVVFTTTVVLGGATSTVLNCLGISARQEFNEFDEARLTQTESRNYLASSHWFNKLDQGYLRQIFGSNEKVDWEHHERLATFEKKDLNRLRKQSTKEWNAMRDEDEKKKKHKSELTGGDLTPALPEMDSISLAPVQTNTSSQMEIGNDM